MLQGKPFRTRKVSSSHIVQCILLSIVVISLAGCVKAFYVIDVQPDGSADIGITVGIEEQTYRLMNENGNDPFQTMLGQLEQNPNQTQDAIPQRWSEDGYEWISLQRRIATLDEVNQLTNEMSWFNTFEITRQVGLLKTHYVLSATAQSLQEVATSEYQQDTQSSWGSELAKTMFDIQTRVSLPGKLITHNGILDSKTSSAIHWQLSFEHPVTIYAESEAPNWLVIGLLIGAVFVVFLGIIVCIILILYVSKRKKVAITEIN